MRRSSFQVKPSSTFCVPPVRNSGSVRSPGPTVCRSHASSLPRSIPALRACSAATSASLPVPGGEPVLPVP
jgi:hypothetical protein